MTWRGFYHPRGAAHHASACRLPIEIMAAIFAAVCGAAPARGGQILIVEPFSGQNGAGRLVRATLDGDSAQPIVAALDGPYGIEVEPCSRKIYWCESNVGRIRRSNLDGSAVELLVENAGYAVELALHVRMGHLYWTVAIGGRIRRANLEIPQGQSPADRTDVVDVVLSLSNPLRLAIDPIGGKLYWSNYVGAQKIQRSDLSGGNVEDVVTQLNTPDGIAVDSTCGKIYWAESGSNGDRIRRANPDGSSVEDLVLLPESGNGPVGVELDVASRVLYWSDNGADCIRRAGMEIPPGQTAATRTDIETLVAGLANPTGLALDLSQPAPGDINGDGGLDADDLPSLVARLLNP